MEFWILALAVLGFVWWRQVQRANRIVDQRARELAAHLPRSASSIAREIKRRRITPGDFAREHGLDPLTFEPTGDRPQPQSAAAAGEYGPAVAEMAQAVEAMRRDAEQELEAVKERIAQIEDALSTAVTDGLLGAEMEELNSEREALLLRQGQLEDLLAESN